MEAEYFPPKQDVILQNEAPTDLYIIVSGAVVSQFIDFVYTIKAVFVMLLISMLYVIVAGIYSTD